MPSLVASLKFLMPLPTPRASSGSRLAPKITIRMQRMTSSSGNPRLPIRSLLPRHCTTCGRAVLLLAILAASAVLIAQEQQPSFHAGVDVVEVYASVTDGQGVPIAGLSRDDFTVTEDGAPQTIDTCAEADVPLSVALALDRSWSMAGEPLARARRAGRLFLDLLVPPDQAMVIAVSGRVEVVAPLSADLSGARAALDRLVPWSTTALHDAILEAVDLIQAGTGRRALVLLSDGVDRYSHATAADVAARVRARDVMVYPVSIG